MLGAHACTGGARLESSDAEAENRCNDSPDSPARIEKRRSHLLMGHFLSKIIHTLKIEIKTIVRQIAATIIR